MSQSRRPPRRRALASPRGRVRRTLPSRAKPPGTRQPAPATTATAGEPGRRRSAAGASGRIAQFLPPGGRMSGRPIKRTLRGPGTPLRLGDFRGEKGRHPATPLPPPASPIREQHRGAGPSSDQTTRESQAGVSRVSGGAANDPGLRGHTHDPNGTGEAGERFGRSATDSVPPQAVRGGGMRRNPADSTNRSLAAFEKLQHIHSAGATATHTNLRRLKI